MRIAVLSAGQGWHVRDLVRAAAQSGHESVPVDFRRVHASVAVGIDFLREFDAVLVRTMPPGSLEQVIFRMDILHRLEAAGIAVLNPPRPVEICVDKYLTTAKLEQAGLRVPRTIVCQDADSALDAFEKLGGDIVLKPLFGSEGRGMMRIADGDLAWRTFRTLERLQCVLYLQEFIHHPGWDLRLFVLGETIVAGMRRHARQGWRTNVAQGGSAESYRPSAAERALALRAAHAVKCPMAGIDLLPGPNGEWYVLEINAVPGWRALSTVSGVDVAARVVEYLGKELNSPPPLA